jgi:dienelactone hydrolase
MVPCVSPDLSLIPTADFQLASIYTRHNAKMTRPPLNKLIACLKEQGVAKIAVTGYCFGGVFCYASGRNRRMTEIRTGHYAFDLTFDNQIQVAVVAHPSLLKYP